MNNTHWKIGLFIKKIVSHIFKSQDSTLKLTEFLNKNVLRSEQFASFLGEHKDNLSWDNIIELIQNKKYIETAQSVKAKYQNK